MARRQQKAWNDLSRREKILGSVMLMAVVAIVVAVIASSRGGDAGTPAAASGATSMTTAALSRDSAGASAFESAFRQQFSALANGRTGAGIRDDVVNTCADLAAHSDVTNQHTAARFARNGITPDAATVARIMSLARTTACPGS
ncbi:hypothetical protein [Frankia sp. Cj3]|uniref:hypothetical protein n=1 Tax=Frankia sp. Cj3 TaxID=2880976 RepID=UPI001EF69E69|nr:hypothetical protein [Frankia sp. Cj3]